MIEGLKILLERMKTHPEEFFDDDNDYVGSSKWGRLIHRYNKVLTKEEIKAYNDALHELHRQRFTADVLESLLVEPVQLDPNTYTIKTAGRDPWGSVTLAHQKAHSDYLDVYEQELQKQIKEEQLKLAADAYKKELKNKSPFEKIKGKKYP